jgi:hypothetical protein
MRFWLSALVALAVVPAVAHHPFTPYYDISRLASITGPIVELRMVNPHLVLVIDGTGPDGRTGRWAFEGQAPNALIRRVPDYKERLKVGTMITVSGWPAKDPNARAFFGREITFADGSKMGFGSTPENSDGWKCSSDPCPSYVYPDVRPQ